MKQTIILATAIALTLSNLFVVAGPITDTYTTGDTLTADKMNNIKTAVGDNDTRITNFFGGDGSAGDLVVNAPLNWNSTTPTNPYFNNISIEAGQTFSVPAGTTIRCKGNFINNGTLSVTPNDNGGYYSMSLNEAQTIERAAHPGDSIRAPGHPDGNMNFNTFPTILSGGDSSVGIPQVKALTNYNQFSYGGGGGTGHQASSGGSGGGLVKIKCNGSITNNGLITANGLSDVSFSGGGGGGGGIVILASLTEILNSATGTISANGSDGHEAQINNGAGGGGGGGIVILAAPVLLDIGTITISGGLGADGTVASVAAQRSSGGGAGGASGGNGGAGGNVSSAGISSNGEDGVDGYILEIEAIPAIN